MKMLSTFLFYFFITFMTILCCLLLILFGYALLDPAGCKTALYTLFTPEMIWSFYILIIIIAIGFLVFNTARFITSIKKRDKQSLTETLIIGGPMLMGVVTMIYLLFLQQ